MKTRIASAVLMLVFLITVGEVAAHPAWAIVADDENQIYVSDLAKIWKIDARGKVSVFSERHTHEMTFDARGNLTGEDLHYEPATRKFTSSLWRIAPNNDFSYVLTPTEALPKGVSIWKNQTGATYYFGQTETEPRENFLLKRTARGDVKVLLGDPQKALQQRQIVPYSLAGTTFAPDDSLYVKNSHAIWKATTDDAVSVFIGAKEISAVVPGAMLFGLTIDAENNVYTADYNSKKTLRIAPDKKISVVFESEPNWSPTGVFYKNKNLYVLEYKSVPGNPNQIVRVQKVAADGKTSVVATINESRTNSPADPNRNNFSDSSASNNRSGQPFARFCAALAVLFAVCLVFRKEIAAKIERVR